MAQWLQDKRTRWLSIVLTTLLSLIALDTVSKLRLNRTLRELFLSIIGTGQTIRIFPLQALYSSDTSPIKFEVVKLVGVTPYNFRREPVS